MTLRPVLTQEAAFIADMRAKYAADADVLRVINYYDAARSVVMSRDERVELERTRHRWAIESLYESVRDMKRRVIHHKAQRKLWQRRAKAVFRLQHGRAPTVAELDAALARIKETGK